MNKRDDSVSDSYHSYGLVLFSFQFSLMTILVEQGLKAIKLEKVPVKTHWTILMGKKLC